MMFCGGVKLEFIIGKFFYSLGVNVKLGYGMIEIIVIVFCWEDYGFNFNFIGKLMLNMEVKIGENNEILVCGGMVMWGYYKKFEEIVNVFIEDGFLKIGDVGEIDEYGNLYIIDCIKELMKILNGKYIVL